MNNLQDKLNKYIELYREQDNALDEEQLNGLKSVYPFNDTEYIFAHLLAKNIISIEEYRELRNEYIENNKYLPIFEITAPRTFGETWAQVHLNELIPELQKPSKKYDPNYSGEYDFWYEGIKIEVKASRGVDSQSREKLIEKALSSNTDKSFNMNFQQIKPRCCDVFVWIAVWRDKIDYWVLSSQEVESSPYYSQGQHRGNRGEGQLWITQTNIRDFDKYLVEPSGILSKIREKAGVMV